MSRRGTALTTGEGIAQTLDRDVIFDKAGVLSRLDDEIDLLVDLKDIFESRTYPRHTASIANCFLSGDTTELRRAAHSLRGAASHLGGIRASAVALLMEEQAVAGDLEGARDTWATLQQEIGSLLGALDAFLAET